MSSYIIGFVRLEDPFGYVLHPWSHFISVVETFRAGQSAIEYNAGASKKPPCSYTNPVQLFFSSQRTPTVRMSV